MMIKRKTITLQLLLATVFLLIIIGFIFVYSASSVFALEKCNSAHYFIKKQFFGFLLGTFAFCCIQLLPVSLYKRYSFLFFAGALILTGLTLVPGFAPSIHGAKRWLSLGGFRFQPSELLKVVFVLYIASFLAKREYSRSLLKSVYIPFLAIIGITSMVLLAQPDFGQTVTLACTGILLLFISHFHTNYFAFMGLSIIPILGLLILLKPYRVKRIFTYLNPWADPKGAGFQIIQSLIAIGSGHTIGLGLGASKQKFFYLPMQHTDFIFSIIAEETGFIGSIILLFLFFLFLFLGLKLATNQEDLFSLLVISGYVLLISLQGLINISVAIGLLPTKGIGLPFVSYGNTALVCNIIMIGIIFKLVRAQQKTKICYV